jgi:uncharacterized protein (DUF433 family)
MNLPDFLTERPFGNIVLTGHRIGLHHVVSRAKEGMTVEQIHELYPSLGPALIQKVLDFYRANQAEVDAYVAEVREELERQEAAAPRVNYDELRRRAGQRKRAAGG